MEKKEQSTFKSLEDEAKRKLQSIKGASVDISKKAVKSVDQYSHKKPWVVVGIVSFLTGILGFLLGRKSK